MRVLILHSRYRSGDASGENRVVQDEVRLLRDAGHAVVVWAPSPDVDSPADRIRTAASAVWSGEASGRVARSVREQRIDVVHAHNLFPRLSPAVLRSARRAGAAVVMTLHNYRLLCLPASLYRDGEICERCLGRVPWRGVAYRCYRGSAAGSAVLATSLLAHRAVGSFDLVDRFLAVSGLVRDRHRRGGLDERRILVRPNFAWPTGVRDGPGGDFVFLGRLAPEKGVDVLLRAWRRLGGSRRLLVVGDGPERPDLAAAAPPGVEFLGSLPAERIPPILEQARAVLVPSRWLEPAVPKVVLEAYAAGVPVVASDTGALPEGVVPEVSGFLVGRDDVDGWARAVRELDDDAASRRLGAGARSLWEERYAPGHALRSLEHAYREAIAAGRSGVVGA
jgi:glycosyltransferase involved in cell wall biosynthesis